MADGTITRELWRRYTALQFRIQNEAANLMKEYISQYGFEDREAAMAYAYGLTLKYGEAAAEAACEMYDLSAQLAGVYVPEAEPAESATFEETVSFLDKEAAQTITNIATGVGNLVKRQGADTTMINAARDGAEWAWVPMGDTCSFCIMLASNGWQRQSKKEKAHHAEHIHNNCDCQYAVRFNGQGGPKGYDPEKYQAMYYGADPDHWNTPDGKPPAGYYPTKYKAWELQLNAMRREAYAENKAEINAQKRSAYAKRRELNSSKAEEIDV